MKSFNRTYSVSKPILKDESKERDGGIEFDLSNIISKNQEIEFDFSSLYEDKKTEE